MRVGNLHRLNRRELLRGSAAFAFMGAQTRLSSAAGLYAWRPATAATGAGDTLQARFSPPPGFIRDAVADSSFAAWLRSLPLKEQGARVHLYTGAEKSRQDVHAGVIDIDVGGRDLQQCADAVMRLRAEWLLGTGRSSEIAFNMTEGGRVPFSRWARGERSSPSGKRWRKTAAADSSYASFRKYLDFVFSYAGTASLEKELVPVPEGDIAIGDVFIKGGFPGHAVLVADLVHNAATQSKRFLLIQSYMPAQQMHVLRNPQNGDGSPWYGVPAGNLVTPEWTFAPGSLRRWPSSR
ncbi:MAG: DUF4846 domain-containing protein [Hyphomicrobiaceae bacterium]